MNTTYSTTYHYAATHSSGRVHLRKSKGRTYTHAIVTANFGGQSFCGRLELARKALASAYDPAAWELVEAKLVTKEEFAALTKASKQKFTATFMGKKFTKSIDGASTPFTCAVGFHHVAHTTRRDLTDEMKQAWTKRIAELSGPMTYGSDDWRVKNIASMEKSIARGYYENEHTEQVGVTFCRTEREAHEYIAKHHRTPAFRTAELLVLA